MKKICLLGVFAMVFTLVNASNVSAWSVDLNYNVGGISKSGNDSQGYMLELTANSDAGLEVKAGQKVTLDLKGHTLTNYCPESTALDSCRTGSSSSIVVEAGGELTIIDSSSLKNGKVSQKANTSGVSAIVNSGKLNIEGGTYEVLNTVGAGLSTIVNRGEMTISDGKFVSKIGGAAAVFNELTSSKLTITGGEFETGIEGSWAIANNGIATIENGTFSQKFKFSVIQNAGQMDINGGNFKNDVEGEHYSLITNENANGQKASLTVSDGNFESDLIFSNGKVNKNGSINLVGGHFEGDVNQYINGDYVIDEEGNVSIKGADYSALDEAIKKASKVDTSKYTKESVSTLIKALKSANDVSRNLTITDQGKVDTLTKSLNAAIEGLKEVETLTEIENPNTFDNVISIIIVGFIGISFMVLGLSINKKAYNK